MFFFKAYKGRAVEAGAEHKMRFFFLKNRERAEPGFLTIGVLGAVCYRKEGKNRNRAGKRAFEPGTTIGFMTSQGVKNPGYWEKGILVQVDTAHNSRGV